MDYFLFLFHKSVTKWFVYQEAPSLMSDADHCAVFDDDVASDEENDEEPVAITSTSSPGTFMHEPPPSPLPETFWKKWCATKVLQKGCTLSNSS